MKTIYTLKNELAADPGQVAAAQALTLDASRPFGLNGTFGLFGSDEWWKSIENGLLGQTVLSGVITSLRRVGMHNESQEFVMRLDSGGTYAYDTVADTKHDVKMYVVGKKARVVLVRDPWKRPSAARGTHSEIVIEIAVEE
ncbi:hypothetical protein [Denitromonas halophila]|uniref:Uncharacterized protein n=1 Tax=Denitromonas halophila TaxID=1629404 RepID=A0A557QYU7_9RHOO|nr:hypothetical protein [Denitromonas halophila]TVO58081.1 hypothetical protein FHP91_06705 [Denitromonas halophila]